MPALNSALLKALASVSRSKGDAAIGVEFGSVKRVLHVSRGELIGADSTLMSDRLGSLLVARGRVDTALLDPISEEARKHRRLLGEQLIQDGLISPSELAKVLEEQVLLRFEGALTMNGEVTTGPRVPLAAVIKKPLGAALLGAFRESVPFELLASLLSTKQERFTQFPAEPEAATLQLQPSEVRVIRRLSAGETVRDILKGSPNPERSQRLLAALLALELIR